MTRKINPNKVDPTAIQNILSLLQKVADEKKGSKRKPVGDTRTRDRVTASQPRHNENRQSQIATISLQTEELTPGLPSSQTLVTHSNVNPVQSLISDLKAKKTILPRDLITIPRSLWDETLSSPPSSIDSDYTRGMELYGDIAMALMETVPLSETTSDSVAVMIAFLSKDSVKTTRRDERYETPKERTSRQLVANKVASKYIDLEKNNPYKVDRPNAGIPWLRGAFPTLFVNQMQTAVSNYAYDWRYRSSYPYTIVDSEVRVIPLSIDPEADLRDYHTLIMDSDELLLRALSLLNRAIETNECFDPRTPTTYLSSIITLTDFPNFDLSEKPLIAEELKKLAITVVQEPKGKNRFRAPGETIRMICRELKSTGYADYASEIESQSSTLTASGRNFIIGSGEITFPSSITETIVPPVITPPKVKTQTEVFLEHIQEKRFLEAAHMFSSDLTARTFINDERARAQIPALMRELSRSGREVIACKFARSCLAHNLLRIDHNTMEQTQAVAARVGKIDIKESAQLLKDGMNKGLNYDSKQLIEIGRSIDLVSSADLEAFSSLTTTAIKTGSCLPNSEDSTRFIFNGIATLGRSIFIDSEQRRIDENVLERAERYRHARDIAFALLDVKPSDYTFKVENLNVGGERNLQFCVNHLISNQIENAEKLLRNYFLHASKRRIIIKTGVELTEPEVVSKTRIPNADLEILRNEAYQSLLTSVELIHKAVSFGIPIDPRSLNAAIATTNTFVDCHADTNGQGTADIAHIAFSPQPRSKNDEDRYSLILVFADTLAEAIPIMAPSGGLPRGVTDATLKIFLRNIDSAGKKDDAFTELGKAIHTELDRIIKPEEPLPERVVRISAPKLASETSTVREVKKPSPDRFEPKTYGRKGSEINSAIQRLREKGDLEGATELLTRSLKLSDAEFPEWSKIRKETVEVTVCAAHRSENAEDKYRAALAVREATKKGYLLNNQTIMQTARLLIRSGTEHRHYLAYGNILVAALDKNLDQTPEDVGIVIDKLAQPSLKPTDRNPLAIYERLDLASDVCERALAKGYDFSKLSHPNDERLNYTLLALCSTSARLCLWEHKDDLPEWAAFQLTHEINRTLTVEEVDRIKNLELGSINPSYKASQLAARGIKMIALDEERPDDKQNPIHGMTLKKVFLLLDNLKPEGIDPKDYYLFMRRILASRIDNARLHPSEVERMTKELLEKTNGDLQKNAELALAIWSSAREHEYRLSTSTLDEIYTRTAHLVGMEISEGKHRKEKRTLYNGGPNVAEIRRKNLEPIIKSVTRTTTPIIEPPDTHVRPGGLFSNVTDAKTLESLGLLRKDKSRT
jgi:hypothetical protein